MMPILLPADVEKYRILESALNQIGELREMLCAALPSCAEQATTARRLQAEHMPPQTLLELGTEGGSLILLGDRNAAGAWRFWTNSDETTFNDLLDEEDLRGFESLVKTGKPLAYFPDALSLLDKYRWHGFVPLKIHPEFSALILNAVEETGTPEELASWISHGHEDWSKASPTI